MRRDVAERILRIAWECSGELNRSVAVMQQSADEAGRAAYRETVAMVQQKLSAEIVNKVCREHPTLAPGEPGKLQDQTVEPHWAGGYPCATWGTSIQPDIARQVLEIALQCSDELNRSIVLVQACTDEAEATAYRNAAGRVMGEIFVEIMIPVYRGHPQLVPGALK